MPNALNAVCYAYNFIFESFFTEITIPFFPTKSCHTPGGFKGGAAPLSQKKTL